MDTEHIDTPEPAYDRQLLLNDPKPLGDTIGRDVAAVATLASVSAKTVLVDLFTGSSNSLYWLMRHVPSAKAWGFELDANIFRLTQQNLSALAPPLTILHTDYRSGLAQVPLAPDDLLITFIAPPWGDAQNRPPPKSLRARPSHPFDASRCETLPAPCQWTPRRSLSRAPPR